VYWGVANEDDDDDVHDDDDDHRVLPFRRVYIWTKKKLSYRRETARQLRMSFWAR